MKLSYEQAELEIIVLEAKDVITTSIGGGPGDNEGPGFHDD